MKPRKAMEGTKYLGRFDDAPKAYLWNGQDQDFRRYWYWEHGVSHVQPSILSLDEGWEELCHADGYRLCGDRLAEIVADGGD